MGLFQHTNFMDKSHYAGNHILYISHYPEGTDPMLKMSQDQLVKFYLPHLKKINATFDISKANVYLFKAPFAQPIFDKNFILNKPTFETPIKNFYLANLDMTYPYDRGTNYAVKLGREVSELI